MPRSGGGCDSPDADEGLGSLDGTVSAAGAVSRIVFQNGKRRIELFEFVTERNLPDEFNGRYEWKGGQNTLHNRFIELGPNQTRWESTCTYQFNSVFLKLMGVVFGGMFRKQNMKFLCNFKAFAEDGHDVRETGK